MIIPPIPLALLRFSFIIMLATSLDNMVLGFASKNENSAIRAVSGKWMPLITDVSIAVFTIFGIVYAGITYHYGRSQPFWTAVNVVTVLLMTAFFTSYLKFDPYDWPIWGPLATVLGIIARAGIQAIYNSRDRELATNFWGRLCGNGGSGGDGRDNNGGGGGNGPNDFEMGRLQRRRTAE